MTSGEAFPTSYEPEQTGEKSGALAAVERLMAKSRFERSSTDRSNTELKIGHKCFYIEAIDRGDHPDIPQVQELLLATFHKEEVDSEEILRRAVEGKTPWGTGDETKYRIHAVKDGKDNVVSVIAGGLLDLRDNKGYPTGKMVYMGGYAVTLSSARQAGFAREAYISAILDAVEIARAQGKDLTFAAGKCSYAAEKFFNFLGWKRAYVGDQHGDAKSYTELKYIQPALDFNKETGGVAEDAGDRPLHFMVDTFRGIPPSKEEVMQIVKAFYRWCNIWPREAFGSDEAHQKHLAYVQSLEDGLWDQLAQGAELIYLDQKSRQTARTAGVTIKGYPEADGADPDTRNAC